MPAFTDLKGKTVVIAGGVKNLGALIARDLVKLGSPNFVLHYHSSADKAKGEELVKELGAAGSKAVLYQGELQDPKVNAALFDLAIKEFGSADVAINTVGMVLKKSFTDITEQEYDTMFDTNSKAAFFFIQEAGKKLADGGKIVTILTSLLAAFTGLYSTYAGAKAPVEHFTRAAAKEFGSRGISVNAVAPGPMDTPFFYGQESPESIAFHKSSAMNGQLTDIKDISPIVKFLVTEGWWFNGQTLFANGGYTTR
uniref:ARAD1C18106p n=1 Tax=Blastobotrys adeninivorans TaxID=409370 RepID=A0A060T6B4_BLAAD